MHIEHLRADYQFECIRDEVLPAFLNTTAVGEHVPEVERSIQTIEGDCRTIYNSLPYKALPKLMMKGLVDYTIHIRNLFPTKNSVSNVHGPTTLITGLPMPPSSYFSLEFGTYCLAHDHPNITNALEPARTTPCIALLPANRNKGWYFYSLLTGEQIIRYKWDVMPIT